MHAIVLGHATPEPRRGGELPQRVGQSAVVARETAVDAVLDEVRDPGAPAGDHRQAGAAPLAGGDAERLPPGGGRRYARTAPEAAAAGGGQPPPRPPPAPAT